MSVWQFLWKAWWREANATTRAIHLAAVVLPMITGAAIELSTTDPSTVPIPLSVWPVIAVVLGAITFIFGITKRALVLERALEPKIAISDPQKYFMPWKQSQEGERVNHHYFITVTNLSNKHIKNCSIKDSSFTNSRGHESPVKGRFFRCRSERAADSKLHAYTRTFDLKGRNDSEKFDICSMDEGKAGSPIFMYYATTSTDQQKNSISRELFPHTLTARVTADNLAVPETKTFEISVSDRGSLRMETLENGAG
jgi:uncharacterized protein affecting Mg2+/Co2+ transport